MQEPITLVFMSPIKDNAVLVLSALSLTLLDFLLGFLGAVIRGEVSSKVLREGIGHKLASVAFLLIAALLDVAIGTGKLVGFEPVMVVACTYLIVMEIVSCLENVRKLSPDLADNPLEVAADAAAERMRTRHGSVLIDAAQAMSDASGEGGESR